MKRHKMVVTGGSISIRTLLGLQIVTGVVVPLLTIARLAIVIRGARERKAHGVGVKATYVGEVFLVIVAVFNTVETVLWGWNCVEEMNSGMGAVDSVYLQRTFWASVFYIVHIWTLKGAFLCLYYDLVPTLSRRARWLLYIATLLTAVSFQGVLAAQMSYCRPLSTNWSTGLDFCSHITSKCWIMLSSLTNIAAGLLISAIPFCIITTLQLTWNERYGFMVIYAIGLLSVLASVLRFVVLNKDTNTTFSPMQSSEPTLDSDWRHTLHTVVLWSTIELLSAHVCICIPAFRLFLRKNRRTSIINVERCESRQNTARNTPTPVVGTVGNAGGNWFDYSAISPLENSPNMSFMVHMQAEEREMNEGRRSCGVEKQWGDVREGGIEGGNGDRRSIRQSAMEQMGQVGDRTSSQWMSMSMSAPHGRGAE